jgi:hypothetical protein
MNTMRILPEFGVPGIEARFDAVDDSELRTCALCGKRFAMPRAGVPLTMVFTAAGQQQRCQIELDGIIRHRCPPR